MVRYSVVLMLCATATARSAVTSSTLWGEDGHRVTGWIAYQHLTDEARAEVDRLLALEETTLWDAAYWPDKVARSLPENRFANPLHYANVAEGAEGYDAERDRPEEGDIMSGIERFSAVLADKKAPDARRLEALRFLAHFVGDLHQPLHMGRNADRGGNDIHVTFFGRPTNLHAVWDTGIITRSHTDWLAFARELQDSLEPGETDELTASMEVIDWANESYHLAMNEVYPGVGDQPIAAEYTEANLPMVEERLIAAGIRLAGVLNNLLASEAPAPQLDS